MSALTAEANGPTSAVIATLTTASTATQAAAIVVTTAENVNLRTGPGTLFTVSRVMKKGTRLQVLGLRPGSELQAASLAVVSDEGISGWVDGRLVSDWAGFSLSIIELQGVQLVRGLVKDEAGHPVSGAGFAMFQGTCRGSNARRTNVTTDRADYFYAYLR